MRMQICACGAKVHVRTYIHVLYIGARRGLCGGRWACESPQTISPLAKPARSSITATNLREGWTGVRVGLA